MTKTRGKSYLLLNADGQRNPKLPKTLSDLLGPSASEILEDNDAEIAKNEGAIEEGNRVLEDPHTSEADKAAAREPIAQSEQENEDLKTHNESIEECLSLREKVKRTFKKYGVLAVAGAIIDAIYVPLAARLSAIGKGVAAGLKAIETKAGEMLPGAIGAIASFLFRAAGEAISFLAKNAWVLIVGIVVYLVDRIVKKG
ncbi:hypothetical protein QZH41_001393 [Actinostola sp. cb2023]|nr:hypothetical protein QZH41_001393 [Actinostola sp. cb2023]